MDWTVIWRDILTPIVLIGLFSMNLITLFIAIRKEKRDTSKNKNDIIRNAKQISRNYKLLEKAAAENRHLKAAMSIDDVVSELYLEQERQKIKEELAPIYNDKRIKSQR